MKWPSGIDAIGSFQNTRIGSKSGAANSKKARVEKARLERLFLLAEAQRLKDTGTKARDVVGKIAAKRHPGESEKVLKTKRATIRKILKRD